MILMHMHLKNLQGESLHAASALPCLKRRKGSQGQDHDKDEQVISESSLNMLVGAVDVYNLEVINPFVL